MKVLLWCSLVIFPSSAALAKEYRVGDPCASTQYQPAPDVAYKPGVDARGMAVAPVETSPPALTEDDFKNIDIDLALPLDSYADTSPYNADMSEARINVGTLRLAEDEVTLNGKSLKNADTDYNLRTGCPPAK